MQKSLKPVLGFLDEGILTPSTETVQFTRVIDGEAVTSARSLQTYDLSDFIDEVYGTAADDAILAEAGDDKVNGGLGDDYIDGGSGTDTLYGGAGDDFIFGGSGSDWLQGDAGNDVLSGGLGNDTALGGAGDDLYMVWDAGDVVTEYAGQGNDTVMARLSGYTLTANVENLVADPAMANVPVTFTGNALNNRIGGSAGNDFLYGGAGNDQLDGKAGIDMMYGGSGNDGYRVDNANDRTLEAAGEGFDSVTATLNWALDQNVENLFFENTAPYAKSFIGYGNELDNKIVGANGGDALYGFGGNDFIDGGDGFDELFGGAGDDIYVMDGDFDLITENANEGNDSVRSNIADLYLQQNLENLDFYVSLVNGQIVGASSFIGRGNTGDNRITGWELNDTLYGNDGNDTLYGLGAPTPWTAATAMTGWTAAAAPTP
jgi:Ca2+-binding RTX toxin-like protein